MRLRGWPVAPLVVAVGLVAAGLSACSQATTACPQFRAAAVWSIIGSSPSWLQYYDAAGAFVGRTPIDVEGMTADDQTPVHHGDKILLASAGNTVKDQTHLITYDPATCSAVPVRVGFSSPLNFTVSGDSTLVFDWGNGWARLHRIGPDGKQTGLFQLHD